ncbi:hypothetical protein B0T13DRAFT_394444, partial [Neurospora crassa]
YINDYHLCIKRLNSSTLRSKDLVFKVCRFYFLENHYPEIYFTRNFNPKY